MIEEIQALLPIIENITSGAMWAFIAYMAVKVVTVLGVPIVIFWGIQRALRVGLEFWKEKDEGHGRKIDLYDLRYKHRALSDAPEFLGSVAVLSEFLKWARRDGETYLQDADLQDIMNGTHRRS